MIHCDLMFNVRFVLLGVQFKMYKLLEKKMIFLFKSSDNAQPGNVS